VQACTSLQTDNHASTPLLSFLQAGCPSCRPTNSVKALTATYNSAIFTDRYSDCCIASLLSTGIKHLFTVSELHTGQAKYIPFCIVCFQQAEISFPFVADHLSARKASNWNDHNDDISQQSTLAIHTHTSTTLLNKQASCQPNQLLAYVIE